VVIATFLESLRDQTKDKPDNTPMDLMLKNELGNGNMHFVQMTCHGKFEVSKSRQCKEQD
jgi:mannosyl-oligosaccharide glucosidase